MILVDHSSSLRTAGTAQGNRGRVVSYWRTFSSSWNHWCWKNWFVVTGLGKRPQTCWKAATIAIPVINPNGGSLPFANCICFCQTSEIQPCQYTCFQKVMSLPSVQVRLNVYNKSFSTYLSLQSQNFLWRIFRIPHLPLGRGGVGQGTILNCEFQFEDVELKMRDFYQ